MSAIEGGSLPYGVIAVIVSIIHPELLHIIMGKMCFARVLLGWKDKMGAQEVTHEVPLTLLLGYKGGVTQLHAWYPRQASKNCHSQ